MYLMNVDMYEKWLWSGLYLKNREFITAEVVFLDLYDELGEDFNWDFFKFGEKTFISQATKEIKKGHKLYEKTLYSVAKCASNDDVLFVMSGGNGGDLYVIIHLTWSVSSPVEYPRFFVLGDIKQMQSYLRDNYKNEML